MLTGISVSGWVVLGFVIWLRMRKQKAGLSFALLAFYVFLISFFAGGPILEKMGELFLSFSGLIIEVGKRLPQ